MTRLRYMLPSIAVALHLSACSMTMVTVPERWQPGQPPACEASRGKPIADLVPLTVGLGLLVAGAPEGVFFVQIGSVMALSSAVGFARADECRKASVRHADHIERQAARAEEARRSAREAQRRRGRLGGSCYANDTCDTGFHCRAPGRCAPGDVGTMGAVCYPNDTCDASLACRDGVCQAQELAPAPPSP